MEPIPRIENSIPAVPPVTSSAPTRLTDRERRQREERRAAARRAHHTPDGTSPDGDEHVDVTA